MLTRRGFWVTSAALITLIGALPTGQYELALLATAYLVWFAGAWTHFVIQGERLSTRLTVERRIRGHEPKRAAIWLDRQVAIDVTIKATGRLKAGWLDASDITPTTTTVKGSTRANGDCHAGHPLSINYQLTPRAPGRLVFPGLRFERSDACGFLRQSITLRGDDEAMVLPNATGRVDMGRTLKTRHSIPGHGLHRYRRPGSGADLLDLRPYAPGDPPKSIAWKVSARRDDLITKEFETEAPVRVTLVVDVGQSVRRGRPESSPLTQSLRVAGRLVGALLAQRDPVGLVTVDDRIRRIVPAGLGGRHRARLLRELSRSATDATGSPAPPLTEVYPQLEATLHQLYPELFRRDVNAPIGLIHRITELPSLVARVVIPAVLLGGIAYSLTAFFVRPEWAKRTGLDPYSVIVATALVSTSMLGLSFAARLWRKRRRGPKLRVDRTSRKQVAAVMAAVEGGGPIELSRLIEDDDYLAERGNEFLVQRGVWVGAPPLSLPSERIREQRAKSRAVARWLLGRVAHGRDNELFVLFIDLLESRVEWETIQRAILVAASRHHQTVIVVPAPASADEEFLGSAGGTAPRGIAAPQRPLSDIEASYRRNAFRELKRVFSSVGIDVLALSQTESIDAALRRVERVRRARSTVRSRFGRPSRS